MISALFTLDVVSVDPGASSVTFQIRCTQSVRRMAISRLFVLRVLALQGRGNYAVCRALKALLAPLSVRDRTERLDDWEFLDKFIARTRVTAIENYIDWENIDHDAALAKMLVAIKLPTSYHLEVTFCDAAYVGGFKVGDSLRTDQADWGIPGLEQLLVADGDIYAYKRDDEHWRLHKLLATYNTSGEHVIAWSNAHDSVLAATKGLLPWQVGDRWGAVDADGATRIKFDYQDVDYQDGRLVFKKGARWIPAEELQSAAEVPPAAPAEVEDRPVESRAEVVGAPVSKPGKHRQRTVPASEAMTRASEAICAQGDRYGLTIAQLLRCWIRVFSGRPDIHVVHDTVGPSVSADALTALASRLPADALALAAELGPLHFCWVFKDMLAETGASSEGYNGGRINLIGFNEFRWYAADDGDEFTAMFDELQPEGSTFLIHGADTTTGEAELVFVNLSERYSQGTVEHYLTAGAASAFVWYWPKRGYWEAEAFLARLTGASLPRSTPADEVVAGLLARGLNEVEAQALQRWLGPDATLLLPA